MWWLICNPHQWYVGDNEEMVASMQRARVFKDRDEAVAEAKAVSIQTNQVVEVMPLVQAAYLEAKRNRKIGRKDKRERKAPCSYLPYARLFRVNPDGGGGPFGFSEFRSLYLAVRGAEVVGIVGEADGQVFSMSGTEYEWFTEEYSVVPVCSDCGEPLDADDDDGDDEAFDPMDFR
jgi:hypothetical protein